MSVRIITDSASDISQEWAKDWNITVLPLKVRFGEEEFLDGVTLSNREFYERLIETDEIPKTSQITPFEYSSHFEKAVKAGEQVVCFCLSSGVSGSFQSACVAAQEFEGDVFVVDTKQFCISEAIIVERAVQMRDQGMSAAQIYTAIEEERRSRKKRKTLMCSLFSTLWNTSNWAGGFPRRLHLQEDCCLSNRCSPSRTALSGSLARRAAPATEITC